MLIDLHVHTDLSTDSNTIAEKYLEANHRAGSLLGAICFTEHRLFPVSDETDRLYDALSQKYGIAVFKGIEADTNLGHLLLFGVNRKLQSRFDLTSRMLKADALLHAVHDEGGIAVPAHPFRDSGFGIRLSELRERVGEALNVVEAINGQNSPEQNDAAAAAVAELGITGIAGSDAHFASDKWFLTCATEFERDIQTIDELCAELRGSRARARPLRVIGL